MTRVQVVLFQGIGPLSRFIRFQTRSPYSHAALSIPCFSNDGRIIEAMWNPFPHGGVYVNECASTMHRKGTVVGFYDVTEPYDAQASLAWLHGVINAGAGYDYRSVLRFLTRRPGASDNRWFCSELVAEFFRQGGLNLLRGHTHDFSPRDIALSPYLKLALETLI